LNGTQPTGYASPVLYLSGNKNSVLIFAAKHLVAVEPRTGHELWRFPWETGWDTNNPDPLIDGDRIFISSFSRGCALLSMTNGQPQVIYDKKILHMHLSAGVFLNEHLYAFDGEAKQQTDFRCIDLPRGEVNWTRKDPPFGSLICADGKLLVLSEKGELLLGDPSPSGFNILARAQILGGLCWTPPALANGLLYARNSRGDLVCVALKK
jgi:outer membrane protein assembly factor BamB